MKKLLLDTNILIWWIENNPRLSSDIRAAIADGESEIHVSSVSIFEISTKKSLQKLSLPQDLIGQTNKNGFTHLPFDWRHGLCAETLPWHHKDPFDRMLIAQATHENLTLITSDRIIEKYNVKIMKA